jgi:tRNA(Ile)-lysidine synthase TilS/MesJ
MINTTADSISLTTKEIKESEIKRYKIEKNFTYHPPKGNQQERYISLRNKAKELAIHIVETCPDSRERSLALTSLENSIFWANASIARNE